MGKSKNESMNESDDLSVLRLADSAYPFENNSLLYGSNGVCPNLALYFQDSLLKIAGREAGRIVMTSATAGNGANEYIRMPPIIDIIRQDKNGSNFGPYEI